MSGRITDVLNQRGVAHRENVSAATLCTFRIGGTVAALVEPRCIGELIQAVAVCRKENLPYTVIGRGSNLLFDDGRLEVVLISTTHLTGTRRTDEYSFHVLCGTSLGALCYRAAAADLSGLEFAWGIPGSVGGAVFMNAGAGPCSMSDVVESVEIYDPKDNKIRTLINSQLGFSYRFCNIQENGAVLLSATVKLKESKDFQQILAKMNEIAMHRRRTQPLDFPSAGSVFKRHWASQPISREIDRLGLKGLCVGGARVSEKHAGFIINQGNATARDVRTLIAILQDAVKKNMGFVPTLEIRLIPEEL